MKFAIYFWLASCVLVSSSCANEIKFDLDRWKEHSDPLFPPPARRQMVHDLMMNHRLIGLEHAQLIKLLGDPDKSDSSLIIYNIEIDHGADIDPVYTKDLRFDLSNDSVVTSFKIEEWRK